ncbi:calcium:proton antiporter [Paludibacterium paludis]|uniref:Calcium:proton antiporter n=1 Tax=Paludibacterium paludis TaxID=1225769 RepID=A0A918UAD1_9NEIS|nr:calcium:proton antiporter [Paludibacterium paludis]GGY21034.1 calcium:proton antiporter [Paludibacterium paludis]
MISLLKHEKPLFLAILAAITGFLLEHAIIEAGRGAQTLATGVFLAIIIAAALRVAHHGELLARRLGEPYGTMILTLSAVTVEVVILAMMMFSGGGPTLARDTVYSALMLDINGILGMAAIVGGLKHGEQPYNLDSGNSYVSMILVAAGVSMFVPEFIPAGKWQAYSAFTIVCMVVLYALFLRMQTGRHSYFFDYTYADDTAQDDGHHAGSKTGHHALLLVASLVLIGFLSELMAAFMNHALAGSGVPTIVPAIVVALISASPEVLTALRAAQNNRMQAVMNIALGASLATVVLTIPVVEAIALMTGQPISMGLTPVQTAMLLLTLLVASINLNDGETNAIEGYTHAALFATFLFLSGLGV